MPDQLIAKFLASLLILSLPTIPHALDISGAPSTTYALLLSPRSVSVGRTFHVMIASEKNISDAEVSLNGPQGPLVPQDVHTGGGPPFWFTATFRADRVGEYQVFFRKAEVIHIFKSFKVTAQEESRDPSEFIWESEQSWDRCMENLYAAWLERLFADAKEGDSWNPLHEITRDPDKNILHNHLGLGEDDQDGKGTLDMNPDCADNPFFLRAYFAWKLGLPFGHHACDRGRVGRPPQCARWVSNQTLRKPETASLQAFQKHLLSIKNRIHSGSARTSFTSETTDLYPIPLEKGRLRPGIVFADPYGHTLTIIRWIFQTEENPGLLLAVDAQPDGTIGVKRFWRGSFFFTTSEVIGEPGFKAFRPIVLENGKNRLLRNSEISSSREYSNFSLEQRGMVPRVFFDTMDRIINPAPLDPVKAFSELHKAVHERLLTRAVAVSNGEKYMKATNYRVVPMPSGSEIFQTTGPWMAFSTPSRDLRLLVALDVLLDFPDKVMRNPEAFRLTQDEKTTEVKENLQKLHVQWARQFSVTYTRSDGTEQELTLEDVIKRMEALEVAYNPNDCTEIRWGATEGSVEYSTCQRRAPEDQRNKMIRYRSWFQRRIIPVR